MKILILHLAMFFFIIIKVNLKHQGIFGSSNIVNLHVFPLSSRAKFNYERVQSFEIFLGAIINQ